MTTGPPSNHPFQIDAWLPTDRTGWPQGVLEALAVFAQGDVIAGPPFFYFADPSRPVWARTNAYSPDSEGPEIVETADSFTPRYGLITTQTCDLVEETPWPAIKPWVQIAPIEDRRDLEGGMRSLLRQGRGPLHLIHLPALGDGFWVADLRIEIPVEKGWLAGQARIDGFGDESAQHNVGERIARIRSRPAFHARFVEGVQRPLGMALRELRKVDRQLYDRMDLQVDHVAVELDSRLNPLDVHVLVLASNPLDRDVLEWWQEWWDGAIDDAAAQGLQLHPFQVRLCSEVTLAEYQRMVTLPLERASQS